MRQVYGVGETCWHWKTRSIYRDNRFDNLAWHKGIDYRYKLANENNNKDVQAVFVSGVLKPPATNRGVGPRKDSVFLCPECQDPKSLNMDGYGKPAMRVVCRKCKTVWSIE